MLTAFLYSVRRFVLFSPALLATMVFAQTGGGGARPGAGGGAVPVTPGVIGPGGGGITPAPAAGARIITDTGILLGETVQAAATIQNATGAPGGGGAAAGATYQWTISGGKITTDATRPTISYVGDTPGTLTLNVVITPSGGTAQSASEQITVISPADAGALTTTSTVATNAASFTATVPPAQNSDRTFRWTLTGAGASVTAGQGTNSITVKPGSPGLLEVRCDVTLQRLVTVPLRAFVVVTGSGAPTVVTINGGDGGGTYPAGSRVDIFANPPATGQVFDKWTGDTTALGAGALAPFLAHFVLTVPTTPVTLTANYKPAPTWTPTIVQNFNPITQTGANNTTTTISTTLGYYIPAGAQGIVFLLHDTGESLAGWFGGAERLMVARDLVAAGYGVAALNSVNRATGAWNAQAALANNPDATNIAAALDKFAKDGALAATKPVFFLGLANGGDAAARFGQMLATATPSRPVKGVVLFCATGGQTLAVTSRVPQFFALAANDETLGTTGLTDARDNSQLLAGRGVATALVNNNASPVLAGRFRTLGVTSSTFTTDDAAKILAAVKTAGMLDANNYVKAIPAVDTLRAALPAAYQARTAEVAGQLAVAYAAQEVYSDADARVIAFLNSRVTDAPVPQPGRLINLSTLTKIAFAGDTFTLGFNITGPQKATLLIRGIGPGLKKFGVDGALTAPRLEVNSGPTVIASNAGWDQGAAATATQLATAASSVGAFGLTPGDLDTAVVLTLDPGAYTATLQGINGATGQVLAEVYDVSRNGTRLTNLSTLGKVAAGEFLVPGLVISGNNPRTLMVRAVGPGLADFGVPSDAVLGDPRVTVLESVNGNSQTIAANNNWSQAVAGQSQAATLSAAFPAVGAFPLKAATSDAALVNALAPGNYTLQAGAAALPANPPATFVAPNQSGTVLVEVYEVP